MCRRKSVEIHLRERVVPREAGDAAHEAAEAFSLFSAGPTDLPVEIRLGGSTKQRGTLLSRREVAFEIRVPVASLEFATAGDVREAELEITFITIDARGDVSPPVVVSAPVRIPERSWGRMRTETWSHDGKFVTRPGAQLSP